MPIDLSAVTLTELRYAVALADRRHFGKAAAACFVTQPTLSAQIAKLERTLGVRLFERSSQKVDTTPEGEEIVREARSVLAAAERIVEVARSHTEPMTGTWRLGVIPTLAPYLLPWLVPALRKAFPKLHLVLREMKTADVLAEIQGRRIDSGILALPVEGAGLATEVLFEEPFLLLAPSGHALAAKRSVRDVDLEGERVLLLEEGHCLRDQALSICARAGARDAGLDGDFRATSIETLRHMVAGGMGITLLPALAVGSGPGADSATVVPFSEPAPSRAVALVFRATHPRARDYVGITDLVRAQLPEGVPAVKRKKR
jgi:LysR family transcriptional regulator, hydrogen peroxide-inducible genes activator